MKIETADFILDGGEATYGCSVYEDGTGFCTRLVVMKNGNKTGVVIHHGPAPEYSGKIPPLYMLSPEGECDVSLMLEGSEQHRHDLSWYLKAKEQLAQSTLISDVIRQEEEATRWIHNSSTFGPLQSTARNGYSHETTVRDWMDTRADRTGKRQFKA